eukprot:CAMPEP_0202109266 /NCGR_PEP_ID=MMETSP0965-20130614/23408_1 /ASSEMBLY_ACC=CAM_ASM_000507 /TAXON_ID=4773 /ORGANISM="Schizochytrium aggregatum, Strain ATCC28209" /LENGTH=312 /DNA_ID=CAMNT_0048678591 /DNA_START=57 /DNA_END=995 /DNA_ORIENTATION=-
MTAALVNACVACLANEFCSWCSSFSPEFPQIAFLEDTSSYCLCGSGSCAAKLLTVSQPNDCEAIRMQEALPTALIAVAALAIVMSAVFWLLSWRPGNAADNAVVGYIVLAIGLFASAVVIRNVGVEKSGSVVFDAVLQPGKYLGLYTACSVVYLLVFLSLPAVTTTRPHTGFVYLLFPMIPVALLTLGIPHLTGESDSQTAHFAIIAFVLGIMPFMALGARILSALFAQFLSWAILEEMDDDAYSYDEEGEQSLAAGAFEPGANKIQLLDLSGPESVSLNESETAEDDEESGEMGDEWWDLPAEVNAGPKSG